MIRTDITTMKEAEAEIQALIDSFTDAIFLEACAVMEDAAQTARQAREEELAED